MSTRKKPLSIYQKGAKNLVNGEDFKAYEQKSGLRQGWLSSLMIRYCNGSPSQCNKKRESLNL